MTELIASLLIIGLLGLLGLLIAVALRPNLHWALLLPVAYPLGAGIYTWSLFLLSWLGLTINVTMIAVVYGALFAALAIYQYRVRQRQADMEPSGLEFDRRLDKALVATSLLIVIGLSLWGAWLAVGRAYWAWDSAAIWGAKGYGIALEGTIFANWGEHGLSYPLNIPLQIATFELLGAESLPGSKLLFPAFYLSVLSGILVFWLRHQVKTWVAGLGVLLIGTTPVVFEHAHLGYADLPHATYLVLGGLYAIEAVHRRDRSAAWLSGVLFGLAAWTRPEGILHGVAALAAIATVTVATKRPRQVLAPMLLAFSAVSMPWVIFYLTIGSHGSRLNSAWSAMLTAFRTGEVDWYAARLIIGFFRRQVLDRSIWGVLFPVCLLLGVLNWKRLLPRAERVEFTGVVLGVFLGVITLLLSFGSSFLTSDLIGLLHQLLSRTFLPTALMAGVVAGLLTTESDSSATLSITGERMRAQSVLVIHRTRGQC